MFLLGSVTDERVAPSLALFSPNTLGAHVRVEKAFNVVGLLLLLFGECAGLARPKNRSCVETKRHVMNRSRIR